MSLLLVGFVGFVLGVVAIIVGRQVDAKEVAEESSGLETLLEPFLKWYRDVIDREWPILTGATATNGQRITAAGNLLVGLGILAMLAGIVSAAFGR